MTIYHEFTVGVDPQWPHRVRSSESAALQSSAESTSPAWSNADVARIRSVAAILTASLLFAGCNTALIPAGVMNSLGESAYAEAVAEYRVIEGSADARMVERVGRRIAAASGQAYQWEFKLLDAPKVPNAFCLPGGKIAVYTGILPITRDEDGLAVVIGHEVAHATEEHGNKRMTQGLGITGALLLVHAYLSDREVDSESKAEIMAALGLGAQFGVVLPYSRDHESEADEQGLRYLVRAGYDPQAAPELWQRMAQAFPSRQPEFMSTHPDSEARAQRLRELIPIVVQEERGAR